MSDILGSLLSNSGIPAGGALGDFINGAFGSLFGGGTTPFHDNPILNTATAAQKYLDMYSDVRQNWHDTPWRHYGENGIKEGREWYGVNKAWNTPAASQSYLSRYPDVAAFNGSPWEHYLIYGIQEGRTWDGSIYNGWATGSSGSTSSQSNAGVSSTLQSLLNSVLGGSGSSGSAFNLPSTDSTPFYKKLWFILLAIVAVVGGLAFVFRKKLKRLFK